MKAEDLRQKSEDVSRVRVVRRDIARIKTIMTSRSASA
jgi:ribosomal protein L29